MAEKSYSTARKTQKKRHTDQMVCRYGQMQTASWDDAIDHVASVTAADINDQCEDGLFVSAFDHGGAGGGYENTWGTGKLYFGAMKIKNIRIHNRPAYNSEVHSTRDMGVGELNNCYEDAGLADTIVVIGTNALETQTNYFLNHWVPNLRGTSIEKKQAQLGGEPHAKGRIIFVDPRRTVTVNACKAETGKDNVLHLAINSGTDLTLFNAILTFIAEKAGSIRTSSQPRRRISTRRSRRTKHRSTKRPRSPASPRRTSSKPRPGSPSRRKASAAARCSPVRRASSGATTITAPSPPS
jgi:arsenite oxidase large subunit